jgi:hypothetical protein
MTSRNVACDGCDGIGECRHDGPETASRGADSRGAGDAVTGSNSEGIEFSSPDDGVTVRLPKELPILTPRAARALLAILVEVTEEPVLDQPAERASDDC